MAAELSSSTPETTDAAHQHRAMRSMYRFHARIYDLTRWAFLIGRNRILHKIQMPPGGTLLEVGCGTGRNLRRLARSGDKLKLIGVDISPDMLERAVKATAGYSRRVFFFERPYAPGSFELSAKVDVVLCSYSLSMFNPGWEAAIDRAFEDLKPGGYFAMVDFHDSPVRLLHWWLGRFRVRIDGQLLPYAASRFQVESQSVHRVAFGLWRYVMFIGKKV